MSSNPDKLELRGLAPVALIRALDALSQAHGFPDRTTYVNHILEQHCREEAHKASVLVRMMRGNPLLPEVDGGTSA